MFFNLCDYSMEIWTLSGITEEDNEKDLISFRLDDVVSVHPFDDVLFIRGFLGFPIPCLMSSARILIPSNPHDNAESETQ